MWTASSYFAVAMLAVTRAMPMPSVMEPLPVPFRAPFFAHSYRLLPGGSASTQRTFAFFVFRNSLTPANVPPVPLAQVNALMVPFVCVQISGPVVLKCASRFAVLSNWFDQIAFGSESASLPATFWYWFGFAYGTVATLCTSAPSISRSLYFSADWLSGITMMQR